MATRAVNSMAGPITTDSGLGERITADPGATGSSVSVVANSETPTPLRMIGAGSLPLAARAWPDVVTCLLGFREGCERLAFLSEVFAAASDEPFVSTPEPTRIKFCLNKHPPPIGVLSSLVQLRPDTELPSANAKPVGTVTGSRAMTCEPSPREGKL